MNTETSKRPMDAYDNAIAYLTEHPEEIRPAWYNPNSHVAGCLFTFASKTGRMPNCDMPCGCLTEIRYDQRLYSVIRNGERDEHLTAAIAADTRIPVFIASITVESLPAFADRQRWLDRELGRTPPTWLEPVVTP